MKKALTLFLITSALLCLASCQRQAKNETYFIHCAAFDRDGQSFRVYTICEKIKSRDQAYFTASASGESIKEAAEKLQSRYRDCYFSTAELYMISENADKELLLDAASEICSGNIFPSKSNIVCIAKTNLYDFTESIKGENDLNKIKKLIEKRQVNCVKFFSRYFSGYDATIPSLYLSENGEQKMAAVTEFSQEKRS